MIAVRRDLTAAELGVFLGLTAARIRHIVIDNGIQSVGRLGRAKLYNPREVLEITGRHDRREIDKSKINAHHCA